jgi:hypothetical protein
MYEKHITAGGRRTVRAGGGRRSQSATAVQLSDRDVVDDNFGACSSKAFIVNKMNGGAYVICEINVTIVNSS